MPLTWWSTVTWNEFHNIVKSINLALSMQFPTLNTWRNASESNWITFRIIFYLQNGEKKEKYGSSKRCLLEEKPSENVFSDTRSVLRVKFISINKTWNLLCNQRIFYCHLSWNFTFDDVMQISIRLRNWFHFHPVGNLGKWFLFCLPVKCGLNISIKKKSCIVHAWSRFFFSLCWWHPHCDDLLWFPYVRQRQPLVMMLENCVSCFCHVLFLWCTVYAWKEMGMFVGGREEKMRVL